MQLPFIYKDKINKDGLSTDILNNLLQSYLFIVSAHKIVISFYYICCLYLLMDV